MNTKTDSAAIKILELLALIGEMSSDEMVAFFKSESYTRKVITALKNDKLIKKSKNSDRISYRLTLAGKKELKAYLPDVFESLLSDRRTMNVVREENGYKERRKKLMEILNLFNRADIKIFPDEKVLLSNETVRKWADNTDYLKKCKPEFYTSVEIKNIIPDFNIARGSRALGILISYGKIFIIYSTHTGELMWRKETEVKFTTCAKNRLAYPMYGKNNDVHLMVFAEKSIAVKEIMNRYNKRTCGKIHPCYELDNMLFALKDMSKDVTLKLITRPDDIVGQLEEELKKDVTYKEQFPFFAGESKARGGEFVLFAFRFNLYNVAAAVDAAICKGINVRIYCFEYQRPFIESIIDKEQVERFIFDTYNVEEGSEADG